MTLRHSFLVAAALMAAATLPVHAETRARYLMGTICEVTARDESRIAAAFAEAERIERLLSTWRDDTELARLNRSDDARVSPELFELLRTAMQWSARTGGAFNPLMAPLVDLWKTREEGSLPSREAITRALERISPSNVTLSGERIVMRRGGAEFEEGGFGKGYAIDRMLGKTGCDALIDFGGQIAVCGEAEVAIADPADRERPVIVLTLRNASLSTSSGSEKTFEAGGRRFSHILDPRTGDALPPNGSVSVVAPDALTADILSTALYVMGPQEGRRWADDHGVAALFITPDRSILPSKRFRELVRDLRLVDGNYKLQESSS